MKDALGQISQERPMWKGSDVTEAAIVRTRAPGDGEFETRGWFLSLPVPESDEVQE